MANTTERDGLYWTHVKWPLLRWEQPGGADQRSKNFKIPVLSHCHSFFLLRQAWGLPSLSSSRLHYWQSPCSHWAPRCTQTAAQLISIFLGWLFFWTGLDKLHSQVRLMLISWTARGCVDLLATVLHPNTHEMLFEHLKSNPCLSIFIPFWKPIT